ncbi:hypothetical protein ACUOFC_59160, partial [Escherichia sp. TWPC-MK]
QLHLFIRQHMLNGSHSFLAYLGYLAGYQHINDCMEDEHYRYAAYGLMLQEQAPTLKVQGVDLQDYANRHNASNPRRPAPADRTCCHAP